MDEHSTSITQQCAGYWLAKTLKQLKKWNVSCIKEQEAYGNVYLNMRLKEHFSLLALLLGGMRILQGTLYAAMVLFPLAACTSADSPKSQAMKPWREELVVIVPEDESSTEAQFEKQLVSLFARQLKVKTRLLPLPHDKVVSTLMEGKAHIAAAQLRSNDDKELRFAPAYQIVSEQVVCGGNAPQHLNALTAKTIAVVPGSAQEAVLREAQQKQPGLRWDVRQNQTVSGLLAEVASGKLDCTIANEEQLTMASNFYPNLKPLLDIEEPSRLAWGFAPTGNDKLFAEAQKFFARIQEDGTLGRLNEHYYGHNDRLVPFDAMAFVNKVRTDLPRLRAYFEEAGLLSGIDWQLLAAISYHESHWNPLATSPTNVRGMMMLTEDTAERMKVADRLDMRQSIEAGARYLQLLRNQLPLRIADEERIWLALAAYNQGMGHLEDARVLTARAGLNPDVWGDVKKMMPLLKQPEYFVQTKHGQARGGEAVIMVEKVRLFYDMLKQLNIREAQQQAPAQPLLKLSASSKITLS